jgi:uncharacterized protein (TIGR02246 family)
MNARILSFGSVILLAALITERASAQDAKANSAEQPAAGAGGADQQAIHALRTAFVNAYNAGKADAVAAVFADDGRITNEEGATIEGRKAVTERYNETFKDNPGAKLELRSANLRFLSPEVAIAEGEAVIRDAEKPSASGAVKQPAAAPAPDAAKQPTAPQGAEAAQAATSSYTAIFVKKNGRWLLADLRDHLAAAATAPTPHKRLQDLCWMVGNWVEEGPDSISTSNCQWDDSGNFLIWKYKVQAKNANASGGTTYIGWDPLTKQITSWVFDSDGGHGEATWSRLSDDQWMAKASGILSDGRTASATQYIKKLGPDRASWTSLDRVAGGESVPSVSEYVLVRRPVHASAPGNSELEGAANSGPAKGSVAAGAPEKHERENDFDNQALRR